MIDEPALRSTDRIEFFLDPLCPWAWLTSRFVLEVAEHRTLSIRWRLISLAILNAGPEGDPPPGRRRAVTLADAQLLRVGAATDRAHGNDGLGRLYTELGTRLHDEGGGSAITDPDGSPEAHLAVLADALAAADLPAELVAAAGDERLDQVLRAETDEAIRRTGADVGTPVVTFDPDDPADSSYFGPVINRIPRGGEALAVFDAVAGLALTPGVAELKRTDRGTPRFD